MNIPNNHGASSSEVNALIQRCGELEEALKLEQTRAHRLSSQIQKLETELGRPIAALAFDRVQTVGNRITGGGLRSLGKRAVIRFVSLALKLPVLKPLSQRLANRYPKVSMQRPRPSAWPNAKRSGSCRTERRTLRQGRTERRTEMTASAQSIYARLTDAFEERDRNDTQ